MAAETIKEFLVGLGFKVDQAGLSRFASGIASASAKAAALGAAVTAAAGAIVMGVKNIAEGYDELDRLGETFRSTAAEIDAFIDTAQILGVSNEKAKESLKALDAAIVDTSMGMGRAKLVFEELGIEVTNADGSLKSTTAVMGELVTALDNVERGKRVRVLERLGLDPATMRVFGKDFAGFNADLQQLQQDLADIDKSVGFDFDSAVASSKEFMLSWRALGREVEKWKYLFSKAMTSVAMQLMPEFRAQLKTVTEAFNTFRKRTMEYMPRIIGAVLPVAHAVMRIAEAFIRLSVTIARGAMVVVNWLLRLNEATNGWLGYIALAIAAWKTLNLAFLMTPIGMLVALATIIALLVDDFLTWTEQGESLIDWSTGWGKALAGLVVILTGLTSYIAASKVAMAAWGSAVKGIAAVRTAFVAVRGAVLAFNAALLANPIGLTIAAVAALAAAAYFLVKNWNTVREWFAGFFAWLAERFPTAAGFVKDAAQKIGGYWGYIVSGWERARSAVADALEWLRDAFAPVMDAWRGAVGVLGGALSDAGAALGSALAGIRDSVADGIDAVMRAFYALRDLPLDEAGQLVGEALVDALSAFGGIVVNALAGIGGAVVSVLSGVFRAVAPLVLSIVRSAAGAVLRVVASIPGAAASIMRLALSAVANIGRALGGVLLGILGALTARIAQLVGGVGSGMARAVAAAGVGVRNALGSLLAWLVGGFVAGITGAFRFIGDAAAIAVHFMQAVWATLQVWFAGFVAWIAESIPGAAEAFRFAADVIVVAGNFIKAVWQSVRVFFAAFLQWLSSRFGSVAEACRSAVDILAGSGQALITAWERVRAWFSDLFSFLSSGFARISEWTGKIGGAVTGAWNRVKGVFSSGTPASAPAPQTQVKLAGGGQNISQNTTINVTGAQNPNATARAISNAQRGVNADMARNLSGATL